MPVVCIPLIHFTLELCRYRVSNTRFHLPQQNNHHHTIIKKDRLLIIADMIFTGVNCQKHDKNCKFQKNWPLIAKTEPICLCEHEFTHCSYTHTPSKYQKIRHTPLTLPSLASYQVNLS